MHGVMNPNSSFCVPVCKFSPAYLLLVQLSLAVLIQLLNYYLIECLFKSTCKCNYVWDYWECEDLYPFFLKKKRKLLVIVIFTNELHCVLPDWLIQHFGRNILPLLSGFGDISLLSCLQL